MEEQRTYLHQIEMKGSCMVRKGGASRVRRVVWVAFQGGVKEGEEVYAGCGEENCINPRHLRVREVKGKRVNIADLRRAQTHCVHGHEFTEENTYVRKDNGGRQCKACVRERTRKWNRWRGREPFRVDL